MTRTIGALYFVLWALISFADVDCSGRHTKNLSTKFKVRFSSWLLRVAVGRILESEHHLFLVPDYDTS